MKVIKTLLIAVAVIALAACSGSSTYDPSLCKELSEKAKKKDLTESDYSTMIDQLSAIAKILKDKKAEFGDDKEKTSEFRNSQEGRELLGYTLIFGLTLDAAEDNLSKSDIKKLNDLHNEFNDLK